MRKTFRTHTRHLWIYSRTELVAHELAHAGRMLFNEPRFEEILACRTSSSTFRKWLGPIVQSATESMLFVLSLALVLFVDLFLIIFYGNAAYSAAMWFKLLPLSMIVFAMCRLWLKQRCFNACMAHLATLFGQKNAWRVIYRLTDSEIQSFAKSNPKAILEYATALATSSLRWQLIHEAYVKHRP